MIRILAIPGSLRANSSSHAILKAAIALAPAGVQVNIFEGLGQLPHFDDSSAAPETVTQFRKALSEADGILICTPEYAFGIPGSLKNALDWTVSTAEFMNKPVSLITASSSGEKGHAALLLVLSALSAKMVENGTLLVPFVRAKLTPEGAVSDPALTESLRQVVHSLAQEVANEVQDR
jgi:NAD(P)H-dependent FMN reductase